MPWWAAVLLVAGAVGVGVLVGYIRWRMGRASERTSLEAEGDQERAVERAENLSRAIDRLEADEEDAEARQAQARERVRRAERALNKALITGAEDMTDAELAKKLRGLDL